MRLTRGAQAASWYPRYAVVLVMELAVWLLALHPELEWNRRDIAWKRIRQFEFQELS
jgi:hypothetical protein